MSIIDNIREFSAGLPRGVKIERLVFKVSEEEYLKFNKKLHEYLQDSGTSFIADVAQVENPNFVFGWRYQGLLNSEISTGFIELKHDRTLDKNN